MTARWNASERGERGAYMSIAQTEDVSAELTAHGKEVEHDGLYV
jgi:hypothetical protein